MDKLSPYLDTILQGDCTEQLARLPDESVDVVFADPPYNLQLRQDLHRPDNSKVDGVDDDWDKFESFAAYDRFSQSWLSEIKRVLKPKGTLWVIGSYHNIFRIGSTLQDMGFWILNDIIWRKINPLPNFRGTRFSNAHETLIWAARESETRNYVFNYQAMKSLNEEKQMRSDWVLPICSGRERLKDDAGKKIHPTQKPESLLYRVLLSSTHKGDVVLDPFFGTGTTGAVAKKLGRHYIGIEADKNYIKAAQARIDAITTTQEDALEITLSQKQQPRIPFGTLLERGMVKPGARLFSSARKYQARVRADGSLKLGTRAGSIHQMGAAAQGSGACNGWTFWHIDEGEGLVPLDELRQRLRSMESNTESSEEG